MIDRALHPADAESVETTLREELARGDAMAGSVLPVLRHLIAAEDSSIFGDEILAHIRGMLADVAGSLLDAWAEAGRERHPNHTAAQRVELARALLDDAVLLSHFHALALEWQLAGRLQSRLALDPVVSPLLQTLNSDEDTAVQELARKLLAAQARWCQSQLRMTLPLIELPADLLPAMFATLRSYMAQDSDATERVELVEGSVRKRHEQGSNRLSLALRLVRRLGETGRSALSVHNAGAALFLTALALGSGLGRDAAVLVAHEGQIARLALALRSAGLEPAQVQQQILALHPDIALPLGVDDLAPQIAAAMLASGPVPA